MRTLKLSHLLLHSLLCCGLNLLIPWLRAHRWGRVAVLFIIANEIRGLILIWESQRLWLPLIA